MNAGGSVNTRSIFSFKPPGLVLAVWLAGSFLQGANSSYVAMFSAEQESYRRILLDGVGDRRVDVALDSLGQAVVKVWGVGEQAYVGRRSYEKGYLIPVAIRVDFPKKNLMTIHVTGTRFWDFVRYRIEGSDLYIIDLYVRVLPRESYFREETISAFWPNGRFQPDITPTTPPPPESEAQANRLIVPRVLVREMAPYRRVVRRAVAWAGGVSGLLLVIGLPLIWLWQRRKSVPDAAPAATQSPPAKGNQTAIPDAKVRAIMAMNGALSYDEASLLAVVGNEKSRGRARKTS